MKELKNINTQLDELSRCSRCGMCRAVCPVFKETGKESMVARGRLEIVDSVLNKKIDFSDQVNNIIDSCLLCGSCAVSCPGKVQVDRIISMARRDRVDKFGLNSWQEFFFKYILENTSLFGFAIDIASVFQSVITKPTVIEHMRHLPYLIMGLEKGRSIPNLSGKKLSGMVGRISSPKKRKLRVGFFPGCLLEYVYTDMGKAIIGVLVKNDIEVVLPSRQKCCGTAVLIAGDVRTAKSLAKSNIEKFAGKDLDAIIVGCASCGSTLKKEYSELLKKEDVDVKSFSEKVMDITEFLDKHVDYAKKIDSDLNLNVTYHDPCHLIRKQSISSEPRNILKTIEGVNFTEMVESASCCGGGGSFSLYYYDIAKGIRDKKIQNIENTKAEIIATSCPGCIMHIEDGLIQKGSKIRAFHVVELLNKAIK